MAGLSRMHKHGRRASGSQCGGNLAANVPALAHTHHHHTTAQRQNLFHGLRKRGTDTVLQTQYGCRFNVKSFVGQVNGALCVQAGRRGCGQAHACIL